jgi:hypothetical protein
MTNPNDKAFPAEKTFWTELTKREYFAIMAMGNQAHAQDMWQDAQEAAQRAVRFADALIAELNKD